MMKREEITGKLLRDQLMTLETYHKARPQFREKAIAERKKRTIRLGEHLSLIFENTFLIQYQIQEILRVEKVFTEEGIEDELQAYIPLIPDGSNFKATMMLEYPNEADRHIALAKLIGVEDRTFIQIEGQPRVYGIADEDLDRSTATKTSAVHFIRYELTLDMKRALQAGAQMMIGCDHSQYPMHVDSIAPETLASFISDLT
ncbi:MAG: DUF3501 family protein [Betaproteobacteria bacterium]|jgi:hypothetical protein